jgi:hypothetical protein
VRIIFIAILFFCSVDTFADKKWTTNMGSKIGVVNPGTRTEGSTYFSLKEVQFAGCSHTDGVILWKSNNENYNEIYSLLLAAKMADKLVRIYYETPVDCSYPKLIQAYLL